MVTVEFNKPDIGVKVVGDTVELASSTGAVFIRVDVNIHRVHVDRPGEEGYVIVHNGRGAHIAAGLATVTPAEDGWHIEAFDYNVHVQWHDTYTRAWVSHGQVKLARITAYVDAGDEDA